MSSSVKLTFGYDGSDFARIYSISVADSIAADHTTIKSKIKAVNQSLAGGTAGGLDEFFLADDYDGTNGKFTAITAAKIVTSSTENIDLGISN